MNPDILETKAFNGLFRQAGNLNAAHAVDARGDNVGNQNVARAARFRNVRTTIPLSRRDVNRIGRYIHHADVVDDDVFHDSAVHLFQRQSAASAEGAVIDG